MSVASIAPFPEKVEADVEPPKLKLQPKRKPRPKPKPKPKYMPDASFIRQRLPIADVLDRLGVRRNGHLYFCWREQHERAAVSVHLPSNRVKCFRCCYSTAGLITAIDLVMEVLDVDEGGAMRWLWSQFPDLPKIRIVFKTSKMLTRTRTVKTYSRARWPEVSCGALALSKPWASFPTPEKLLAMALLARMPTGRKDQPVISTNYWELMEWAGIGNRRTLSRALQTLCSSGLFSTVLEPTGYETPTGFATRSTVIRLTWFSTAWQIALGRGKVWCPPKPEV